MRITESPRLNALFCSLALVVCTLAALPFAETGFNDDWSYIHSARTLAQTGHIVYVGWASAMLGWQLALGALFIKLFGFSFSTPRASVLLISAIAAFLLQRTFARLGLQEWNATFATLTIVLSPLFLPLAFSFMSDLPGVFCTVLCFYTCIRALQAETDRASFLWLAFASISSAIGGTARQTAWLGLILMVPSTFWLIRRRRPPIVASVVIWLLSLGVIVASMRWFAHQPYSLREHFIEGYIDRDLLFHLIGSIFRATVEMFLFSLPVLIAFITRFPFHNQKAVRYSAIAVILIALAAIYLGHTGTLVEWLAPFQLDGNFVSPGGLVDVPEIGTRPVVLQPWVQAIVTIVTLAATISFLSFAADRFRSTNRNSIPEARSTGLRIPTWTEIFVLFGPFTLAYIALLLHRGAFNDLYDRYLLPILPIALILLVRFYQQTIGGRLPAISVLALLIFTVFGIAGSHDVFAVRRARVVAADKLIAAGIPRTSFYGGFEYDGWTQIEAMGFVNSGTMLMPDGYHDLKPIRRDMTVKPCDNRFAQNDPAIQPRYAISFDQVACDGASQFAPVPYRAWLPPFHRDLYIRTVTRPAF